MKSETAPDFLSVILGHLKLKSFVAFDASSRDWALSLSGHEGFKLNFAARGECWVEDEEPGIKFHLGSGDCCLTSNGKTVSLGNKRPFAEKKVLGSPETSPVDSILTINGGGTYLGIGTKFQFTAALPN